MARDVNETDLSPVLTAARRWIDTCLIADQSVFTTGQLWTPDHIREVRDAFVGHPDTGQDRFIVKLRRQMTTCSAAGQQLMSEMLWALLLFPSSVSVNTKKKQILEIWRLSGADLLDGTGALADDVLKGIGSGGVGFNANRPKELTLLLAAAIDIKELSAAERRQVFSDYDAYIKWINTVPQFGNRQFRHMLRYFAFPDRVERMCSNDHRRAVLEAFNVGSRANTRQWSDEQLDAALLQLRQRLERQFSGQILDFYESPLKEQWQAMADEEAEEEAEVPSDQTAEPSVLAGPINLILYGPPGTGKTRWLQSKFKDYTDQPQELDETTWLQGHIGQAGWRSIIAAALADLGGSASVPAIRRHRWVEEKVRNRGRSANVNHTIWATLQSHTPLSVETVKYATRREPFLFSKRTEGDWRLLPDWQEQDEDAGELFATLHAGPQGARRPIQRYRVVTFHPSFSYEDFVRGIRPTVTADDGTTQFRNVDGVFKQLCDEARANPSRRYALFIDEINRGNIAKVFGELITLIEIDKRGAYDGNGNLTAGIEVQLPGSHDAERPDQPFSVPANLDIYGTMNTADRSIALLDIALRRRFEFKELEPDYEVLDRSIDSIHLGRLLAQINDRLEYLLDRDHRVGHAYMIPAQTLPELRSVFSRHIIPLLQEFFFDDFSKVAYVLETSAVDSPFVSEQRLAYSAVFSSGQPIGVPSERTRYVLTLPATWSALTFRGLYDPRVASDEPLA